MACQLNQGISKGCRANSGGIRRVFIANFETIVEYFYQDDDEETGIITGMGLAGAPYGYFYEFVPTKMSGNWVENIQSNVQNGTIIYEQVVNLVFAKNEANKRNIFNNLKGEYIIIIQDMNNTYWVLGKEHGLSLTGGSSSSGTSLSDLNGWTVTFTGYEKKPAFELTSIKNLENPSDCYILGFVTDKIETHHATINNTNRTVSIVILWSESLNDITPMITVADGSSIEPASGVMRDWSSGPLTYTVRSSNGRTKVWTVNIVQSI